MVRPRFGDWRLGAARWKNRSKSRGCFCPDPANGFALHEKALALVDSDLGRQRAACNMGKLATEVGEEFRVLVPIGELKNMCNVVKCANFGVRQHGKRACAVGRLVEFRAQGVTGLSGLKKSPMERRWARQGSREISGRTKLHSDPQETDFRLAASCAS